MAILWIEKKLILYQGALYHHHTPAGELEEVMWVVVPMAHWVAAMNGCHRDAGHKGQQQMLYLLHHQFWWPSMAMQMQKAISNHEWCIQHGGTCAKAPMQPIIATAPLELLHAYFTGIEMTMELDQPPIKVNILVFCNHFKNTSWLTWPSIKPQRLLLNSCGRDTSQSSDPWPSSWVIQVPILKVTSLKSCMNSWANGRLGLHLTMLRPMDRLKKLTKHLCT